jgi:ubiquinone/menaquinone biosynthesis C-methylase UbiE
LGIRITRNHLGCVPCEGLIFVGRIEGIMPDPAHSFADAEAYERFMGRWSRAAGTIFLDWVAAPAGARWLDVGCGTGIFTELVVEKCSPAAIFAVDESRAQIDHACGRPIGKRAQFRVADAQALPFADATFDVVAAALVINFVPDPLRTLSEMRRVARPGGIVAGYVWDFEPELSPSGPLRLAMGEIGADVPPIPGAKDSSLGALSALFERTGLEAMATRTIEIVVSYPDFDEFWHSQMPSYSPATKMIAAMTREDRARLVAAVKARLPFAGDGSIAYSARANAIKGRLAG